MAVFTDWVKSKKEILNIFLHSLGFEDFNIEFPPEESFNRSLERLEHIFDVCIDVRKTNFSPGLKFGRIGIYCRSASTSSETPVQTDRKITIDIEIVDPKNKDAYGECRKILLTKAEQIQNLIVDTFLMV